MKMTTVSQCRTSLAFGPLKKWPPHLPAYACGGELLCDFEARPLKAVVDLEVEDPRELALIFFEIHSALALPELARLWKCTQALAPLRATEFFPHLLELSNFRFSESLVELLVKLETAPREFHDWASDRALGAKELAILKSVPELPFEFLRDFALAQPTRAHGAQLLEQTLELFLTGTSLPELVRQPNEAVGNWVERIWKMRHPRATQQLQEKTETLLQLELPKHLAAKIVRTGTDLNHEIKFQFKSVPELEKNITALANLKMRLEKHASDTH